MVGLGDSVDGGLCVCVSLGGHFGGSLCGRLWRSGPVASVAAAAAARVRSLAGRAVGGGGGGGFRGGGRAVLGDGVHVSLSDGSNNIGLSLVVPRVLLFFYIDIDQLCNRAIPGGFATGTVELFDG